MLQTNALDLKGKLLVHPVCNSFFLVTQQGSNNIIAGVVSSKYR